MLAGQLPIRASPSFTSKQREAKAPKRCLECTIDHMICSSWPSSKIHSDRVHQKRKARRNRLCHDAPLICGTVKRPIDSNNKNAIVAKSRVLKRISKNDSALQKHMQWLKQLQEDRRKVDEKKEIEEQQRLKRRNEFMEREAKKRLLKKASKEEIQETFCEVDDNEEISLSSAQPQWATASVSGMETKSSVKPAWCQSEEANESAEAMAAINDEADLLDFVQDLDFDQYDEDLELQALITQVKERIKKLQREKKKDETTLQLCVDVSMVLVLTDLW